jgi:hypothetical protein
MLKMIKKHFAALLAGSLLLVVLFALTAAISYRLGERHISELVLHSSTVPDGKITATPPPNYDETIANLREERDRLSNDYDSACYNYQALYDAYDALYAKAGASSGQEKIVRPDSARGNEVSCYR